MTITATGLGSGLDVNNIVKQLVAAERLPFDQALKREDNRITPRLSALGEVKAAASKIQDAVSPLRQAINYQRKSATSSNTSALRASASSVAVPASYQVKINQIATTQTLASTGFTAVDEVVGTGELQVRFGTTSYSGGNYQGFTPNTSRDPFTITIDSSNNTLTGVMNAINTANKGVRASVVNDGSGFRLLLTSESTGASNSIEVSVTGDGDGNNSNTSGLSQLAFNATADNLSQTQAGQDAQFVVNGITIGSASNVVTSAIPGVTLTLQEVTSSPFTLTVAPDTSTVVNAAKSFVTAYNEFRSKVTEVSGYDAETKIAGPLISDFTTRSTVRDIEGILRGSRNRLSAEFSNLAEFGFTTNKAGILEFDEQKFTDILVKQPDKMARLYKSYVEASDANIRVAATSTLTEPGVYPVNITSLATQGRYTGTGVLPNFGSGGSVTINGSADEIELRVNGISTDDIELTRGTYTSGSALATMLQTQINANTALVNAGIEVEVLYSAANNNLEIKAVDSVGSNSRVDVLSTRPQVPALLGLNVGNGTAGSDVAGSINGVAASGSGNLLTAAAGNPSEGIVLEVGGTTTGARGNVTFDEGIWPTLFRYLDDALGADGAVTKRIDGFEKSRKDLEERSLKLEERWKTLEVSYRTQYNALDRLVAQLRSTSSFLQGQLAAITGSSG